jgi:hypothetical protein
MSTLSTFNHRRHTGRILAAGAAVLVLAGCTSTVPGVPLAEGDHAAAGVSTGAPSTSPGIALSEGFEAKAASYAMARAVDPCALHVITAAAEVTGMVGDTFMPGTDLATCDLDLLPATPRAISVWKLSATVGAALSTRTRQESTPEQIEGLTFLRGKDAADGRTCEYVAEIGPKPSTPAPSSPNSPSDAPAAGDGQAEAAGGTMTLRVRRDSPDAQPKTACQVGKEYLAKVGRYWKVPALRRDGLTKPPIPIGNVDPCAGLAGVERAMGGPLLARPQGPYDCVVQRDPSQGNAEQARKLGTITAKLSVKWDPRASLNNPTTARGLEAATIAGKPAVVKKTAGDPSNPKLAGDCTLNVIHESANPDENVAIKESNSGVIPISVQVIEVRAGTCELATAGVESLIAAIR